MRGPPTGNARWRRSDAARRGKRRKAGIRWLRIERSERAGLTTRRMETGLEREGRHADLPQVRQVLRL